MTYSTCFRLTHEELQELSKTNFSHAKLLKGEQEVIDIMSIFSNSASMERYTITEFKNSHPELQKYTSQQIGKVLTKLEYEQVRVRDGDKVVRKYILPRGCVKIDYSNPYPEQYL